MIMVQGLGVAVSAIIQMAERMLCSNTWIVSTLTENTAVNIAGICSQPNKHSNSILPSNINVKFFPFIKFLHHQTFVLVVDRSLAEVEITSLLFFNEHLRVWVCSRCEIYSHASKAVVKKHIDSKHMGYRYKCDFCDKLCPTLHAMSEHVRNTHK